jgi:molybdopterin-containing oxidoreductase family membrane subunit
MINLIIESILFGFTVYSILQLALNFIIKNKEAIFFKIDYAATLVVRFAGILFFIILASNLGYNYINNDSEYGRFGIINRMFGVHWFGFWIYPIAYFGLTQLLWKKNIRESKLLRIIIVIPILFALWIERIIIIITSLHRDYIPTSWTYSHYGFSHNLILNCIIEIGIFGLIVGATYLILTRSSYK